MWTGVSQCSFSERPISPLSHGGDLSFPVPFKEMANPHSPASATATASWKLPLPCSLSLCHCQHSLAAVTFVLYSVPSAVPTGSWKLGVTLGLDFEPCVLKPMPFNIDLAFDLHLSIGRRFTPVSSSSHYHKVDICCKNIWHPGSCVFYLSCP